MPAAQELLIEAQAADGTGLPMAAGIPELAGPGVMLAEAGADVAFYLTKPRDPQTDENYAKIQAMGLFAIDAEFDQRFRVLRTRVNITDIVLDGLLGTGVSRPIEGQLAQLLNRLPQNLVIVGVEGANFAIGAKMTEEVERRRGEQGGDVHAVDLPV